MEYENGIEIPDAETDYHGHPNYGKVLITLLILFGISLVVGFLFSPLLAVLIIFGTAVWKISLVMKNFMHLKYEPFIIWLAVIVVVFLILALFWGLYPDITAVPRDVVPRF